MTAQGWLQIAIYVAVLTALTPLLGGYMARVYRGEVTLLAPVERLAVSVRCASTRRSGRTGSPTRARRWCSARSSGSFLYVLLRTQGIHPFNPEGFDSGTWDVTLQHRVVVRLQHQLAVLRRGDDALLLLPDGRARRAELHLRGGRHLGGDRGHPRLRRALGLVARQLLAGPHAHAALRAAADLLRGRAVPGLPGRDPDARRLHRGGRPDARARPGGLPGGHQDARHQRRRLLQRQQLDAVREPDRALELRRRCC